MRLLRSPSTVAACILLSSCGASMPPSPPQAPPDPLRLVLFLSACRPPAPLADASFGATTAKLLEVAEILAECRATGEALLAAPGE